LKTTIASAFALLFIGAVSCTTNKETVTPAPIATTAGAKGGSVGGVNDVPAVGERRAFMPMDFTV
jgi:hypothetical protein